MSFGGGFFGSGESNSETDQDIAETGQQISDFGQGFSLSNIKTGDGADNININATDYGAIGKAFELADHTADLGFQAVESNLMFAGGLVNAVLDSNQDNTEMAFEFTAGAFQEATSQIQDAWQGASRSAQASAGAASASSAASSAASAAMAQESLEFAAGLTGLTIEALEQSRVDSLEFAAGTIGFAGEMALSAMAVSEQARTDSLEFGAGAMELAVTTAVDTTEAALYYVDGARADGLAYSERAANSSLNFGAASFNAALEFGAGSFNAAIESNEQSQFFASAAMDSAVSANNKALDYVQASTESEDKKLAQQLMWGVFALAALMAYKGMK